MSTITVFGFISIPEADLKAVLQALPEHIKLTLAEPGCLTFSVTPSNIDPRRYEVYEEFVDQQAFDYHQQRSLASEWAVVSKNVSRFYQGTVDD